ncbi:MAG TPA: hypothetical protein VKD65_15230 [Candidatus Angelobacter sp.]|nr:hypothetical protein [Candidatus Angelobacter sp.]
MFDYFRGAPVELAALTRTTAIADRAPSVSLALPHGRGSRERDPKGT